MDRQYARPHADPHGAIPRGRAERAPARRVPRAAHPIRRPEPGRRQAAGHGHGEHRLRTTRAYRLADRRAGGRSTRSVPDRAPADGAGALLAGFFRFPLALAGAGAAPPAAGRVRTRAVGARAGTLGVCAVRDRRGRHLSTLGARLLARVFSFHPAHSQRDVAHALRGEVRGDLYVPPRSLVRALRVRAEPVLKDVLLFQRPRHVVQVGPHLLRRGVRRVSARRPIFRGGDGRRGRFGFGVDRWRHARRRRGETRRPGLVVARVARRTEGGTGAPELALRL